MFTLSLGSLTNSRVFIGSEARAWNPFNFYYIVGSRKKASIINLMKTFFLLKKSFHYYESVALAGGNFLFINPLLNYKSISHFSLFLPRWFPGVLSNFGPFKKGNKELFLKSNKFSFPSTVISFNIDVNNYLYIYETWSLKVPSISFIEPHVSSVFFSYFIISSTSNKAIRYYFSIFLKNLEWFENKKSISYFQNRKITVLESAWVNSLKEENLTVEQASETNSLNV